MKKNKPVLITIILLVIALCTIVLVKVIQSSNKINNTDNPQVVVNDDTNNNDSTEEENPTIEQEKVDDLMNNLGNGTSNGVKKVEEGKDEKGNRTYTYTFVDNSSQTVTIRKIDDIEDDGGSGAGPGGDIIEDPTPDDPTPDNPSPDNPEDVEPGTVYEKYLVLTPDEQLAFYLTFENPSDFYKWYDAAKAEYDALHPTIEIGEDEIIDFGERTE